MLCAAVPVSAAAETPQQLHERYAELEPKLRETVFDAPIYIQSEDRDNRMRGEVYGVLPYPFSLVRNTLTQLPAWCDFATLHFNVKACAHRGAADTGVLVIFSGGKKYQDPREARRNEFVYHVRAARADYFHVEVTSDGGVLDTHDYRIDVAAVPLGERTFVRVGFSYRYKTLTRMLSATYFATFGRNKVGFSVVGIDKKGEPVYVNGRNGAMERSVMRYYFGLQALFESLAHPEPQRFEWRLRRWYALTDKHRRQLYELDEDEYLAIKRKERADSLTQHEAWPTTSK